MAHGSTIHSPADGPTTAKVEICGPGVDSPPDTAWLRAVKTAEQRAVWRREILATTKEDFVVFGERLAKMTEKSSNSVVFGSKKGLEDANAALGTGEQLDLKEIL